VQAIISLSRFLRITCFYARAADRYRVRPGQEPPQLHCRTHHNSNLFPRTLKLCCNVSAVGLSGQGVRHQVRHQSAPRITIRADLRKSNHAKLDHNGSITGFARQSRSDCADHGKREIAGWARKADSTLIADARYAIDRQRASRSSPSAREWHAVGEHQRSRAY
jgi:hypothetical protein